MSAVSVRQHMPLVIRRLVYIKYTRWFKTSHILKKIIQSKINRIQQRLLYTASAVDFQLSHYFIYLFIKHQKEHTEDMYRNPEGQRHGRRFLSRKTEEEPEPLMEEIRDAVKKLKKSKVTRM